MTNKQPKGTGFADTAHGKRLPKGTKITKNSDGTISVKQPTKRTKK